MKELNKVNYVSCAEQAIKSLMEIDRRTGDLVLKLTTSKIRNLLAMVSEIYNDINHYQNEKLDEEFLSRIQYLKMRFVYEAGREQMVKSFIQKTEILENIDAIKDKKENLVLFCNYMEALVAYHKFNGGRD